MAIRVQAVFQAEDANDIASTATIGLSVNGATAIFPQTMQLQGYGVPVMLSYATTAYAGPTWAANGATVVVRADGPIRITNRTLFVARLHKAR